MRHLLIPMVVIMLTVPAFAGEVKPDKETEPDISVEPENEELKDLIRKVLKEMEDEKQESEDGGEKKPLFGHPLRGGRDGFRIYFGGEAKFMHLWYQTNENNINYLTGKESSEWEGEFFLEEFKINPEIRFGSLATLKGQLTFKNRRGRETAGHTHFVDVTTGSVLETTTESTDKYKTGAGIEEMFVTFHLPAKHEFLVGLNERWIRPERHTQNYPITGVSFWYDETMQ
ncbi:MAG: hypothetical protein ACYS8W_21720, partial [Planctomycetota bacterium]